MKGRAFGRITAALAAAAATAAIVAPASAQPVNGYAERLSRLDELPRRAALRGTLVNSGQRCGRIEIALPRGRLRNLAMWSVRCVPGGDYGIFIGPDGSAQVRTCADLRALALPVCGLPRAAAPQARRDR